MDKWWASCLVFEAGNQAPNFWLRTIQPKSLPAVYEKHKAHLDPSKPSRTNNKAQTGSGDIQFGALFLSKQKKNSFTS